MMAFIGLGNPGSSYAKTKHNVGFWIVNELADRWDLSFRPGRGDYLFTERRLTGVSPSPRGSDGDNFEGVLLAKPTSGMNRSGIAVKEIRDHWDIRLSDLFVIVDDVDLPLGVMRIRPGGGDGCHKGMESIIYSVGTLQFPRIRVGIATSEQLRPAENYVLKPFRKRDESVAREMVRRVADAVDSILSHGLQKTMSEYNRIGSEEKPA
ncbi:MAG: aminoacyl-tRNA hydrolase [Fidelibacterota bacterium]